MSEQFQSTFPRTGERAGALDLLRFLAAAFVVLYHFGSSAPIDLTAEYAMLDRGWLATDFFIIVSGYVLGRAYGGALDDCRMSPQRFVVRRLARIWPAHLVVLMGFAVMLLVATSLGAATDSPERFQVPDFVYQALLVHAWGVTTQPSWNEPSWTLSALVVCYALFPAVWFGARPLLGRGWALVAGFGLLISSALLCQLVLGTSLYDLAFHHGVLRALPLFVLGMLLARFIQGRRVGRAGALATGLAAFGAVVAIQASGRTEVSALVSIIALATLIVSADGFGLRRSPTIKAAADISFALFITHAVIGTVWFSGLEALGVQTSWWTWIGAWVAVLGGAALFHHLVDKPIQNRLRSLIDRTRSPLTAPESLAT